MVLHRKPGEDPFAMAAEAVPASLDIKPEGDSPRLRQQREGAFHFIVDGDRELLRIDPDGTVYREGREIGTDEEVFRALQKWARTTLGGQ